MEVALSQGEVAHRKSKHRYDRTSKKDYTPQLADIERREARIAEISHAVSVDPPSSDPQVDAGAGRKPMKPSSVSLFHDPIAIAPPVASPATHACSPEPDEVPTGEGEDVPLGAHHHIAISQKKYEYIPHFVRRHLGDPAAQVCMQRLHLCRVID